MAATPTAQQWIDCGLVPTAGLAAWHMYEAGVSGHNVVLDYSGNDRPLNSAASNSATLIAGVGPNNTPAWYFNGTNTVPLAYTGAVSPKHVFILASGDDAAFNEYRGLLSGVASGTVLVSENTGTQWFDATNTATVYKSGTSYTEALAEAPVGGNFALVEVRAPGGIALDGLQVGQQKAIAGRIWKGYFSEQLVYTTELSESEIARVYLYFNIKFHQFKVGLPFYFPCNHIVPNAVHGGGTMVNNRYLDAPQTFDEITDSWTYEDAIKDFNEVADDAPRRWEYGWVNVAKEEKLIFDEFNRAARRANKFYFHDNDDFTWSNVRIEEYARTHEEHKRWRHSVAFRLVGYGSTSTPETIDQPAEPEPEVPEYLLYEGDGVTYLGDPVIYTPEPVIDLSPTISTATLPDAGEGDSYSQTVSVTSGDAPITFAVQSGALPTGLSLNTSTGAITGTASAAGTYGFTIRATDADGDFDDQAYSVVIDAPAPAVALIASVKATAASANTSTSSAIDTTGADLLVLAVAYLGGNAPTISDSKSNTWTALPEYGSPNSGRLRLYYCAAPTVGTGHTFTAAGAGSYNSIAAAAFENAAGGYDGQQAGAGVLSGTTQQPGSITPSQANCVVVTALQFVGSTGTAAIDSGFTLLQSQVDATNFGIGLAYKIQTTAAATNATWTAPGAADRVTAAQAAFRNG